MGGGSEGSPGPAAVAAGLTEVSSSKPHRTARQSRTTGAWARKDERIRSPWCEGDPTVARSGGRPMGAQWWPEQAEAAQSPVPTGSARPLAADRAGDQRLTRTALVLVTVAFQPLRLAVT